MSTNSETKHIDTVAETSLPSQELGIRKGGKGWKETKKPLRIRSVGIRKVSTWDKRQKERLALKAFKEKRDELKEENEQERKVSNDCLEYMVERADRRLTRLTTENRGAEEGSTTGQGGEGKI